MSPALDRRELLGAAGATLAAPRPAEGEEIALWPDGPPGGAPAGLEERWVERSRRPDRLDRAVAGVTRPRVVAFPAPRPDGRALLVVPGGGYVRQAYDHEGAAVARRLAAAGMSAYVLLHRLPGEGWAAGALAPLQDAQRALRLVRARAAADRFDPARLGVLGFSAGGHVAGRLATTPEPAYPPVDAADAAPVTPAFAALMYPVATLAPQFAHAGSRRALLGAAPDPAAEARESLARRVTAGTPPTFLVHAADDRSVPVENSLELHAALRRARVPAELHLLERGGHGFGLDLPADAPGALWPDLLLRWSARPPPRPETAA